MEFANLRRGHTHRPGEGRLASARAPRSGVRAAASAAIRRRQIRAAAARAQGRAARPGARAASPACSWKAMEEPVSRRRPAFCLAKSSARFPLRASQRSCFPVKSQARSSSRESLFPPWIWKHPGNAAGSRRSRRQAARAPARASAATASGPPENLVLRARPHPSVRSRIPPGSRQSNCRRPRKIPPARWRRWRRAGKAAASNPPAPMDDPARSSSRARRR